MFSMRKVLLGVGALCLMAGLSPQAKADFSDVNPPNITWKQFANAGYVAVGSPVAQPFVYTNSGGSQSGTVVSQVYKLGNLYAYVYQVQVVGTNDVGQFTVDWAKSAFATPTTKIGAKLSPVYEISSQGGTAQPNEFYLPATLASGAQVEKASHKVWGSDFGTLQANFPGTAGADTSLVVVFSGVNASLEPIHSIADGNGLTAPIPQVYAPAPEPPALALCGIGVLGLLGGVAYRRFRPRPLLA